MEPSPRPSIARRLAHISAFVLAAACSDATGPDESAVPDKVTLGVNGELRAIAGSAVAPIVVTVVDASGRALPRVDVRAAASDGGTVTPDSARTDGSGQVRITWRLGLTGRQQTLEVRAGLLAPVTATATAEGRVTLVELTLPADSLEVGQSANVALRVVDHFGDERTDLPVSWSSTTGLLAVDAGGRVSALGEGDAQVAATVQGVRGARGVRVYDVPTSLELSSAAGAAPLVDVADSLRLTTRVLGRTGRALPRDAQLVWSCSGAVAPAACGPVFRPRLQALAEPVTVKVVASLGDLADTLAISMWEEPMSRMMVSWPPAPFVSMDTLRLTTSIADVTLGDTTRFIVETIGGMVDGVYPYRPDRPYRVSSSDTTVATATLGPVVDGRRVVNVVGRRQGDAVVRILVNGAGAGVTARVAARAANACAPDRTIALDLPLGGTLSLREGDAVVPRCLQFDRARDQGRVYLVVADVLPRTTTKYPNAAGDPFGVEGQGLFMQGVGEPRAYPSARIYTPGWVPPAALVSSEPLLAPEQPTWTVRGVPLRELPPDFSRAGRATDGARLMAVGQPPVAVGDTFNLYGFAYFDPALTVVDGAPVDTRIVVRHVGARLVIAEMLDVLRGRLRYPDGSVAGAIPADQYGELERAYEGPARQLGRLFPGTPTERTLFGRDFGTHEMVMNVPLAPGYGGYAGGDFVAMDYYFGSFQPSAREIAEFLLAHEFAHMRQMTRYWPQHGAHPWLIEGVANFAERLAMTARGFGTDTPSRTARATTIANPNHVPGGQVYSGDSFFSGYANSSYPLDYLADHVEAAGGDALAAVRDVAQFGGSARTADSVVARWMPGLDMQTLLLRARTAVSIEQQRLAGCTTCVAPDAALPAWTRYLQYDLPSVMTRLFHDEPFRRALRPGTSGGVTLTQRTGSFWPMLIDGRGDVADASWIVDMSAAPQTTLSIVRIR